MPEASLDASILIATSWQALNRAKDPTSSTFLCDNTVCILFASFFIEANLNFIFHQCGLYDEMINFFNSDYPGMGKKLGWFYYKFISKDISRKKTQKLISNFINILENQFSGFKDIYNFRNDLSHGVINQTAKSLNKTEILREQAKSIVNKLFSILSETDIKIERDISYMQAIDD